MGYFGSYGLYLPILILQGFCIWHAYKNGQERNWYFLIIFLPLIGCAIYLYKHFYSRKKLNNGVETLKGVINKDYSVEQLLKKAKYSDTIKNRLALADEYFRRQEYGQAISLYKSCLTGHPQTDDEIEANLLISHYLIGDYEDAVGYGNKLKDRKSFQDSEARIAFAWSLHHAGQTETAEKLFQSFNVTFTNYPHRTEYADFLLQTGRKNEAQALLFEMREEIDNMTSYEQKLRREDLRKIKAMMRGAVSG